jgi:hypothetical protein
LVPVPVLPPGEGNAGDHSKRRIGVGRTPGHIRAA